MANRFRGAFFDLSLNSGGGCGVIHDDAELIVVDEEPACHALTVGVEGDGLNGQVTHVSANDDPHETEQAARNR